MSSDNSDNKVLPFANPVHGFPGVQESRVNADEAMGSAIVVCQFCNGTGTRLKRDGDSNGNITGAVICDCRRSNSATRSLDAARIPLRFREKDFHNYYPKNDSQFFAHGFSTKLAEEYPEVDAGLLIMGPVGVGKTHLAIAIL